MPRYVQQIPLWSFFYMFLIRKVEFPENFFFFNSGRGALKWLLSNRKLLIKKKLHIGMPCYACYTVYQSVSESGNEAILLDINPTNFSLAENLSEQINELDVLVWINYFGFKYNNILKEIRAKFPSLIIIEDCSHVDLRDYLRLYKQECYSDYSIFSFNFRKPITIGGGGLLIASGGRNTEINYYLNNRYKSLKSEKLSMKKIIYILKYNFSYNYLLFLVFNKLILRRRRNPFKVEQLPVKCLIMNRTMKKLFFTQYIRKVEKRELAKFTLNYFNCKSDLVDNYSSGSLCYFPVSLDSKCKYLISNNIDKFMLWDNLVESYRAFDIRISQEYFPLTFNFLHNSIFLPARCFKNPVTIDNHFKYN